MTHFTHLLHDVTSFDEVFRRNEEARWSSYLALVEDVSVDDEVVVLESWDDPEDEV